MGGGSYGQSESRPKPAWAQSTGPAQGGGGVLPGDWRGRNDTKWNDYYNSFDPSNQPAPEPSTPTPGGVQSMPGGSGWRGANMGYQAPDVPDWLQTQWGWDQQEETPAETPAEPQPSGIEWNPQQAQFIQMLGGIFGMGGQQ